MKGMKFEPFDSSQPLREVSALMHMPWRRVLDLCDLWSRLHRHRHRIEKSLAPGAWRVTCLTEEPPC